MTDTIESLWAERDALMAQVERFREASEHVSMAAEYADPRTALAMAESVHWLLKVADETPAQSISSIKADGINEALAQATQGFSLTVVRVDELEAIAEKWRGE